MSENKSIDFNILASECLIAQDTEDAQTINCLENLKTKFSEIELIAIFNYFLKIEYRCEVLCWLIRQLDKYRDSSSLAPLTELLLMKEHTPHADFDKEYYTNVRVLCAKAISNLKDHSSVHALMYCLNDKDENYKVRLSCADALGRLGDRYAVTSLMSVASDESEKSVYVRESAATALGLIGDMRAVDSLVKILETKTGIMDKFTYLKEKAVEALCRLNPSDDRAFKVLKKSLKDENPQVRINTIEALMDYGTQEAVELIREMLTDRDDEVKRNAVIALYNLEGEEELNRIIESAQYCDVCKEEAENILREEQDD